MVPFRRSWRGTGLERDPGVKLRPAPHAQTPSSPVRTGAAGLPPLEPGPYEADHQLNDRLKRGPQQFWYPGRLARAGANSRLRGGITGWPVATVGLCAWMTPLGWRAWRSGCCAPILTASSSRPAAVGRITPLLMVLTTVSGMRYHEPSARDAHRRIAAFFKRHLTG
jgi:hypothetical protein